MICSGLRNAKDDACTSRVALRTLESKPDWISTIRIASHARNPYEDCIRRNWMHAWRVDYASSDRVEVDRHRLAPLDA